MRLYRILLLALFYFVSVFFAISALAPPLAVLLSMLAYLLLDAIQPEKIGKTEKAGLLFALLLVLPFSCLFAGLIWWVMRGLGLWTPLR
jgi:hypothetical protein